MAEEFRKSTRDFIYREQGISSTARAVLKEEIHYNEKLTKMISIYGNYFSTKFDAQVDAFTEMFYSDRYTVDGKVDKVMYDKLRDVVNREFTESCLSSLAYQVKAIPVIDFTKCSKIERHIVVALGDLRKSHSEEYKSKIEDYMWEAKKHNYMIKDLVDSVKQQHKEVAAAKEEEQGMQR